MFRSRLQDCHTPSDKRFTIRTLVNNDSVGIQVEYGKTRTILHRDTIIIGMNGKRVGIVTTHDITAEKEVVMWNT